VILPVLSRSEVLLLHRLPCKHSKNVEKDKSVRHTLKVGITAESIKVGAVEKRGINPELGCDKIRLVMCKYTKGYYGSGSIHQCHGHRAKFPPAQLAQPGNQAHEVLCKLRHYQEGQ